LKLEGDGTKWMRFGNVGGPGKSVNPKAVNRLDSVEVCGTLGHETCDVFFRLLHYTVAQRCHLRASRLTLASSVSAAPRLE
jgi:hypothetical protein